MITTYPALIVHLWQSTLFAAFAGLLTLLLKRNQARTRYWVWLAALVKFLIPFGVLVSLGGHLGSPGWTPKAPAIMEPTISFVMGDVGQSILTTALAAPQPTTDRLPALLFGVWACGFLVILSRWLLRWMQVRADVRAGSRLRVEIGIPVVSSPVLREPGVFGILHPVLLLPEGMAEHLSKAEWEAILAHELCHARCYDNLTAAIYMLVETIFWFHPLVWWMGKRLVAERERACDEEVLRLGSEPKVYAEGILKVCELYLESPLECVAGVTGSNLRQRIRAIMTHRGTERMKMGKKLLLVVAGMLALAGPVVVGILNTPSIRAQSPPHVVVPAGAPASVNPSPSRQIVAQQRTVPSVTQSAAQAKLEFEVASVRRVDIPANDRGTPVFPPSGGVGTSDPTHFAWHGTWLINLMQEAFGVRAEDVSGPAWLATTRYDIVANIPEGATKEQFNIMLGNLLQDRFHLRFHIETRVVPAYALRVAKNGPKFKESDPAHRSDAKTSPGGIDEQGYVIPRPDQHGMVSLPHDGQNFVTGQDVSMAQIAQWLSHPGGPVGPDDRPVIDETGLVGHYDFKIHFESFRGPTANAGVPADPAPTKFGAAEEQLGLKLEPSTASIPYLIIDSVDREPTEN